MKEVERIMRANSRFIKKPIGIMVEKHNLIVELEKKYNLRIKIYDSMLIKLYAGSRFNAFVILPTILSFPLLPKKDTKKIKIYVSKNLFLNFPLPLFEYVLLHEIGHTKSKLRIYEDCADSFVLNILGVDEYIKRKIQIDVFFRFKTFDISQLKKLQNINYINLIKLRLHLISLEDV